MKNKNLLITLIFLNPLFLVACATSQGIFVHKSAYNVLPQIQGTGETSESAHQAALRALPENYELDSNSSWTLDCTGIGRSAVLWDQENFTCNPEIKDNLYLTYIPVLPKDKAARKEIEEARDWGKEHTLIIKGTGKTDEEAEVALTQALPQGYTFGPNSQGKTWSCTKNGILTDPKTRKNICDPKIPGNLVEVSIRVTKIFKNSLLTL
jgi:hypothetical protein